MDRLIIEGIADYTAVAAICHQKNRLGRSRRSTKLPCGVRMLSIGEDGPDSGQQLRAPSGPWAVRRMYSAALDTNLCRCSETYRKVSSPSPTMAEELCATS